ncbi:MAG: hypothetical protein ACI4KM_11995 [Oscillospiraceae bacterium]
MDKYKDAEMLVGVGVGDPIEIPNTLEGVADFICTNGIYGDVVIWAFPAEEQVLDTYGLYINKCSDQDYLKALLPVLIPKQHEAEQRLFAKAEAATAADNDTAELDEEEMDR